MFEETTERVRQTVDAVYRSESRRVLATLIRLLGDFELAEEAMHEAFAAAIEAVAARRRARQPAGLARHDGTLQGDRQHPAQGPLRRRAARAGRPDSRSRLRRHGQRRRRRRPAAAGLYLLSPGAAGRRPGGAHPAGGLRPHDRRDRPRLSHGGAHHRPEDRARQEQDPRRPHPLRGAGAGRPAREARHGPARHLPRLQRRLLGFGRSVADPAGSLRRSDPPGEAAGRAAARPRGDRAAGPDAAAGIAAPGPHLARGRPRAARGPGPLAVGPAPDRRRHGSGHTGAVGAAASAPTPCRLPSPPSTPRRPRRLQPTGRRSPASTACWPGRTLRR